MASATIDRIMESAENQAREGGYNAFSFREIAKEIGIKSASIHYHFPTKADLATALAKRYTDKFIAHVEPIKASKKDLQGKLSDYADLFYNALKSDQKMCLCGLFAAEMNILPEEVKAATRRFFEANLENLQDMLKDHGYDNPEPHALKILANLEGAMLLGKAFESEKHFKRAVDLSNY